MGLAQFKKSVRGFYIFLGTAFLAFTILTFQNCGQVTEGTSSSASGTRKQRSWFFVNSGNPVQSLTEKAACSAGSACQHNWDQWNFFCKEAGICCKEGQTPDANSCRMAEAPEEYLKGVDVSTNRGGPMTALEYWNCFSADQCEPILHRLNNSGGSNPSPGPSLPPVPSNIYCGTPGDASLYKPEVQVVKAQYKQTFASLKECNDLRDGFFKNGYTCSKMVSGSGFWCAGTADASKVVLEAIIALPVLKSSGNVEVPYDHYFNGVNCDAVKTFLNNFTDQTQPLMGNFTDKKAVISGDCHDAQTAILKVQSVR